MHMLEHIVNKTLKFIKSFSKEERKSKGQFFTSLETAQFMAKMFNFQNFGDVVSLLDPGAGTGILTAAFIDEAVQNRHIKKVNVVCYETDPQVLPILKENLEFLKENAEIEIEYSVRDKDYLLSQSTQFENSLQKYNENLGDYEAYDAVIGNPPYLRIMKNSKEALAMPSVVHGAPNMYFLFAAMSIFNLRQRGQLVYIIPRSWTSGEYFKAFRNYMLANSKIRQIHLFVSRNRVFSQEQVLQEAIIIKIEKEIKVGKNIVISSSQANNDFDSISSIVVPYNSVVAGENNYVFLPTSQYEISVIKAINKYTTTLPDIGYRMRTGIVVDFRERDSLRAAPSSNTVPLFYSQHIKNGKVLHYPSGKGYDWLSCEKKGLIQPNQNYLFCKRFTAKEEKRRLQCGIYLAETFPSYKYIGTQNKLNYINRLDAKPMTKDEIYGIYALLNSTLFDQYYRILNGSTQVNSTEINHIPVPGGECIKLLGQSLQEQKDLTTKTCDELLMGVYDE